MIKPTCEKFGLTAIRVDDIYKSGLIINDIARSIEEASVIIADVTIDNPNVFYEVGYAHGIKKPTILLSDGCGSFSSVRFCECVSGMARAT